MVRGWSGDIATESPMFIYSHLLIPKWRAFSLGINSIPGTLIHLVSGQNNGHVWSQGHPPGGEDL